MSEIDIFVSSMSIATLDHMKNLKINTLDGSTGHLDEEIDLTGHRAWTSRLRGSFLSSAFAASAQLLTWRIDSALGSEFESCPPVAAHPSAPIKWLSAAIREFKKCPPVAFHPS